ncbi:hypothetical protein ABMA28_002472 [Loxostege sticticalis]|uniref:tRNA (34-2'-O)-methyltransferase regulator WDR6 n=2 Tax=Loxostege sticticalis TaxID=481309 RepID=A0ABD0SWX9_LOXSC
MSQFIHTDVTAVKLHQDFIITGIGSSASVFERNSLKFLERINCLIGQKIYGIVPLQDSTKVLIFGGKQCTVICIDCNLNGDTNGLNIHRLFKPLVCEDWLHSATWVDTNTVALLTAHNAVQIWDLRTQCILSQHFSADNSILYSGLLLPLQDGLLVFAGTVFSEVIIHTPLDEKPLHHLKGHRGVIFSISCNPQKRVIVSTSDDRSVRIWGINPKKPDLLSNTTEYWKNIDIVCNHEVYGHTARVMRSSITNELIVSVGEDSVICFWGYDGKLLKKHETHQNSPIWSVDTNNSHLVTGGGDGAVILHPLSMASDYGQEESIILNTQTPAVPKKIAFTARNNLVILNDIDSAIHYHTTNTKTTVTHKINHGSTYKLLSVSSCKQLIAVADMSGKLDVFAENCKEDCITKVVDTNLNEKVFSMQWAGNRHLVFCGDKGNIMVASSVNSTVDIYGDFVLPNCKERWLTAAAMDVKNKILIVGDRCGNVHVYVKDQKNPVKTFNKVHGRYGPTSITIKNNEFITTGRDGTIRYFSLNENDSSLAKYMTNKELEFQWVEKFIDKEENIICGFKERIFVVYNVQNNLKLIEVSCGGGHRSWDVVRYIGKVGDEYEELIKLVYVKNSEICSHTFQLSKIMSKNVINSSHSKEINCLKSFKSNLDKTISFYVTGGEDTTLRLSSINSDSQIRDEIVSKHLSNVRTLKIVDLEGSIIVVSAGGRAQIRIKLIHISRVDKHLKASSQELIDYLIKGKDKERKNNQTWRNSSIDFDPETRIMDVDVLKQNDKFLIFAGCSDACLRVFSFIYKPGNVTFEPIGEMRHHKTCILKTTCVNFLDKDILITCSTRGEVSLWDVTDIVSWDDHEPFFSTITNKCGINSIDTRVTCDNILIATGGDDNAIHLTLLEFPNLNLSGTYVKHRWSTDKFHCSQVTGVKLVDDLLVSTSIDQRVTLAKWRTEEEGIRCDFQSQIFSDIADIQGMEILSNTSAAITVCVFGKGLEVVELPK